MDKSLPTNGKMLWRGATKRCPICGNHKLFRWWFKFPTNCPRCGFKFEREIGFFTGGWMLNLCLGECFLFIELMAFVFTKAANRHTSATPFLYVGIFTAIFMPMFTYPFSRTLWSAIELIAREPTEAELVNVTPHK